METDLGKDPAHSALALVPVTRHLDCFSKDSETLLINLLLDQELSDGVMTTN